MDARYDYELSCKYLKLILESGRVDDSVKEWILAAFIFKNDDVELVKYLVSEYQCNINGTKWDEGQTALIRAVIKNDRRIIDYLLNNNADKSIKDYSGKTAYDYAVENAFPQEYLDLLKP